MTLAIDHVIYGVEDLDATAYRLLDEHGLASYEGGVHLAFGTRNRIVPLGTDYIELMAVSDAAVARSNPLGQRLTGLIEEGDGFLGWVVRIDDITRVTGYPAVPGSRTRPDGRVVSWRAAGMAAMLDDPSLPFFIRWDDMDDHPSGVLVDHRKQPRGISWIELSSPDEAGVRAWLFDQPLGIRFVTGEPGVRAVGIATARREIVLR